MAGGLGEGKREVILSTRPNDVLASVATVAVCIALYGVLTGVAVLTQGCRTIRDIVDDNDGSDTVTTTTSTTTTTTQPPVASTDDPATMPLPEFGHGAWVRVSVQSLENPAEIARSDYREDGFVWQMERGAELAAPAAIAKLGRTPGAPKLLGTHTSVLTYWDQVGRGATAVNLANGQPIRVGCASLHTAYIVDGPTMYRLIWTYDHNRDTLPASKNPLGQSCKPGNYWFGTGVNWVELDQYGGNRVDYETWAIRRPPRTLHMERLDASEAEQVRRGRGN